MSLRLRHDHLLAVGALLVLALEVRALRVGDVGPLVAAAAEPAVAAGAAGHVVFFLGAGFDSAAIFARAAVFAATLTAAFAAAFRGVLRAAGCGLAGVGAAGLDRHCGGDEDVVGVGVLYCAL